MATDPLEEAMERIERLEMDLAQARSTLQTIYRSDGWKLLQVLYRVRNTLLPPRLRTMLRQTRGWVRRMVTGVLGRPAPLDPGEMYNLVCRAYPRWIASNEPDAAGLAQQRRARFPSTPTVSLLVPVFNTPLDYLHPMIDSVRSQTYPHWELCLADGGSTEDVRAALREHAAREPRIKLRFLPENRGIVGNTNAALELAGGDFIGLLDHDALPPFALHEVVTGVHRYPQADFFYSDEDKLDERGRRCYPFFKPDWSHETLLSCNYICHLSILSKDLMHRLNGFRSGFDGAQDYDLILRATEQARQIIHLPRILYHWRVHPQSTASRPESKLDAYQSGRRALLRHLERLGVPARVSLRRLGQFRIHDALDRRPSVSAIVLDRGDPGLSEQTLASLRAAAYQPLEVHVVGSLEGLATLAQGEVLLFLDSGLQALNPQWLETLVAQAVQPGIGAVGAKLCFPDESVRECGLVLGLQGLAGSLYRRMPRSDPGYLSGLEMVRNCATVSQACLAVSRERFEEVGGRAGCMGALAGLDVSLRLLEAGRRNVCVPDVELIHHGPIEPASPENEAGFQKRWAHRLEPGDPYYNPNLSRDLRYTGAADVRGLRKTRFASLEILDSGRFSS
jgi:glycosyltransferase involved in cell wall biosynthesis